MEKKHSTTCEASIFFFNYVQKICPWIYLLSQAHAVEMPLKSQEDYQLKKQPKY